MKILVTGSSSCMAQALLPQLCADPDVTQVTGIDLRPPQFTHAKFDALIADFRTPPTAALLHAQDALVHLAYVVLRGRMHETAMHEINVAASFAMLQAPHHAGVRRIIHLSSGAVYGRGAGLAETAAFAPLPDFCYGRHKAELESLLARDVPECVRLRPHVILGPHAQPTLRQILNLPFCLRLADPHPELQCVHEDDVAAAILASLHRDVRGAFNLAAADTWNLRAVMRSRHAWCLPLPVTVAHAALRLAHGLTGWGGEPGWLAGLQKTLTLDCRRGATELDWQPRNRENKTYVEGKTTHAKEYFPRRHSKSIEHC